VTIESDGAILTTRYGSTVEKGLETKKPSADAAPAGDKGSDERAVAAPAKDKGAGEPTINCARTCKEPYQPCGWTTRRPNARGEWRPQCLRGPVYDRCMQKDHPHPEIWKTCR
jgi:hypothetical protein